MNKKILVSLVFGLAIAACNSGGGGSSGSLLPVGNYVINSWTVPANGICPTIIPQVGTQNLKSENGVVSTAGQLCDPLKPNECITVNTASSSNCVTYPPQVVPEGVNGTNITIAVGSKSCTYSSNILYAMTTQTVIKGQLNPNTTLLDSCVAIVPGTVSASQNVSTIQKLFNVVKIKP